MLQSMYWFYRKGDMRLNLQPALKELGYNTIAQQVAMVKIFAYSQDQSRIISDEEATETLLKKQFADVESSVEWLDNLSQDNLVNEAGVLLHNLKNKPSHDAHKEELVALFTQAGVITSKLPESKNFDYAIVLGGASPIVEAEVGYLKKLWDKNQVRFNDVVLLGGRRIINQEFEKSAESNEISMMVKHYKDQVVNNDNADSELRDVSIHIIDTPARMQKDGSRELPTAEDTLHEWLLRRQMIDGQQSLGKILVISNNPFIGRSNAVVRDALGRYSDSIETVGTGISPEMAKGYIGVILHYVGEHITHDKNYITSQLRKQYPDLAREIVAAKLLERELAGESFIKDVNKPADSSSHNSSEANNEEDGQRYRSLKEDQIQNDIVVPVTAAGAAATAKNLVATSSKKTESKSDKNTTKGKSGKKSSKGKSGSKNSKSSKKADSLGLKGGSVKSKNILENSPLKALIEQISQVYSSIMLSSTVDGSVLGSRDTARQSSKRKAVSELSIMMKLKMLVSRFTNGISADINAPVIQKREFDPEVVNTSSKYHKNLQIKRKIQAFLNGNNQAGSLDEMLSGASATKSADKLLAQGDLSLVGEKELRTKLSKSNEVLSALNDIRTQGNVDQYIPPPEQTVNFEFNTNDPVGKSGFNRNEDNSQLDAILLEEVLGFVTGKFGGASQSAQRSIDKLTNSISAAQNSMDNFSNNISSALGLNKSAKYRDYESKSYTSGASIKPNYNVSGSKSISPDKTNGDDIDKSPPVMKR